MGVDVVDVDRMRAVLDRRPSVVDRVFTDSERAWCSARVRPWVHFAARFAAKEAVRKALGRACDWSAVEVRRHRSGAPYLALGRLTTADGADVTAASLSLTHDGSVAIAVVALEVDQPSASPAPSSGSAAASASR